MPYFDNDGIKIYYEIEGTGPDLVLLHGFLGSIQSTWRRMGWIDVLKEENRMIMIDHRGHGKSDKPTDPKQYGIRITKDIIALMDSFGINKPNFLGYSMGSRITMDIALRHADRIKSAIIGGIIISPFTIEENRKMFQERVKGFKADKISQITNPTAKLLRLAAERWGIDLNVAAAISEGYLNEDSKNYFLSQDDIKDNLKKIKFPVLSVIGSDDNLPGDKTLIAQLVPDACHFQIQGKNHLTVISDPKFYMVVKEFLNYVNNK